MKTDLIILLLVAFSLWSCDAEEVTPQKPVAAKDTIPAVIVLTGSKCDTAYLYAPYADPGAQIYDDLDGKPDCGDYIPVTDITGSVNTKFPGICFLNYQAKDAEGNLLAAVTRTVYVMENKASFLNGNYDVVCTCTAITRGLPEPVITVSNYTATAASGSARNYFNLTMLNIGAEYVKPETVLNGSFIEVGYFSPDYHYNSSATGTVSASKSSFTIDTQFYQYAPFVTNLCKNVYTKQLVIK